MRIPNFLCMSTPFLVVFSHPLRWFLVRGDILAASVASWVHFSGIIRFPSLPCRFRSFWRHFFSLFLLTISPLFNITHVPFSSFLSLFIPPMIIPCARIPASRSWHSLSSVVILALVCKSEKATEAADLFDISTATNPKEESWVSMVPIQSTNLV